jgi:hypothetical protein
LIAGASAQHADSTQKPDDKKSKNEPSAKDKDKDKKPGQAAEKPAELKAGDKQKSDAPKQGTGDKEEYDVSEVPIDGLKKIKNDQANFMDNAQGN